jgi:hypothetical protein
MPGGGLFALVAYGAQNTLLSGNPDFTYFYKTYKKYSHYAEESVSFAVDGPQDLSYDQPIQIRCKIQRIAELVRDMYFTFQLPDIYSKYIPLPATLSYGTRTSQYHFAWVNYIGCHLIQSVGCYIGGQRIQEFDGSYLIAKAQCDLDAYAYQKWERLVGNVPEVYDPAKGLYAGGAVGMGYPSVYNNNGPSGSTTIPANVNRPSIPGRRIQVPLPFWFSESTYESLPLVALQYHECEIRLTLRPIRELYRILDRNGAQVAPGYEFHESPIPLQPQNVYYTTVSDLSDVTINQFLTDVGTPAPLLNTWQLRPQIQMTYVYLTDEERTQFASEPLQYLVRQVTRYEIPSVQQRQLTQLETHNPIERLLLLPRRSDAIPCRNELMNLTNWVSPTKPPFLPSEGGWVPYTNVSWSSGRLVLNGQRNILRSLTVLGDGNPLQEEKPIDYFTDVVPWKYLRGKPTADIIVYPFAMTSPTTQPTGSLNSSRIKNFQVDLDVYPVPPTSLYQYDITIYVESLNWVTIASGMGGLKYAL